LTEALSPVTNQQMNRIQTIVSATGLFLLASATSSCQDMNTFFTGEKFSRAPEGSPRVEAELTVRVDDAFMEAFASVEQAVELGGATSELVLDLADVGTRFYPVPSEEYESQESRPRYFMLVEIDGLEFDFDTETVSTPATAEDGESDSDTESEEVVREPVTRVVLRSVTCSASASLKKRRKDAPSLVVGHSRAEGVVRVPVEIDMAEETYTVRSEDGQSVAVRRADILAAVDRAVVASLRDMVRAVDREFAFEGTDVGQAR
jgi:hypothetical protein